MSNFVVYYKDFKYLYFFHTIIYAKFIVLYDTKKSSHRWVIIFMCFNKNYYKNNKKYYGYTVFWIGNLATELPRVHFSGIT